MPIGWRRVPEIPDILRSDDWRLVIRRSFEDGATLYALLDSSPMLDQSAPLPDRTAWRLVGWYGCSDGAKEAAEEYRADLQNRARTNTNDPGGA